MSSAPNPTPAAPFLGIDFGTSQSKMAWFNPATGQAEALLNAEGQLSTSSLVYYGEDEVLVGDAAIRTLEDLDGVDESQRRVEMSRFVHSVKRRLSKQHTIPLPSNRQVGTIDVAAEIIRKLKTDAEEQHFHERMSRAVITHPAVFVGAQRDCLRQAALDAGFSEVELYEEPVAAAVAYAAVGQNLGECVLVYDLGAGTFDLAVVKRDVAGQFRSALEADGYGRCGGDDFDQLLYDFWDRQVRAQYGRGIVTAAGPAEIDSGFLRECRKRKENLSIQKECQFQSRLDGNLIAKLRVSRVEFEAMIGPLVDDTVLRTQKMIERAEQCGMQVDTIVMIGGATRVPLVAARLATLPVALRAFQQKDIAVALGAAYRGRDLWVSAERQASAQRDGASLPPGPPPSVDQAPTGLSPVTIEGLTETQREVEQILIVDQDPTDFLNRVGPSNHASWRAAAEQGNPLAQFLTAIWVAHSAGNIVPESVDWMCKAANQGHPRSMFVVGRILLENNHGNSARQHEGIEGIRAASEAGLADAQCFLGSSYENGTGVERNAAEAIRWYTKSAEQGFQRAPMAIAMIHLKGEIVPKSPHLAFPWLLKVAERGDPHAQHYIGKMYLHGVGVGKDVRKALEWFDKVWLSFTTPTELRDQAMKDRMDAQVILDGGEPPFQLLERLRRELGS